MVGSWPTTSTVPSVLRDLAQQAQNLAPTCAVQRFLGLLGLHDEPARLAEPPTVCMVRLAAETRARSTCPTRWADGSPA